MISIPHLRPARTAWSATVFLAISLFAPPCLAEPNSSQSTLIAGSGIATVETGKGKVQGFVKQGIATFRGVPYAKAERFMPPEDVAPWEGTRFALSYGNICPQTINAKLPEPQTFFSDWRFWPASEECQNLNVWTPGFGDGKKRPVMVWLHGGGFFSGSSMELPVYDGTRLAQSGDVVVVSVNHRLNVLGFLDLSAYGEEFRQSANAGMLDIVAALQWVQKEIGQFGGDPGNVTIFGQSGGGAKVATLMAAPSAKGLFQKAIIQSGAPGGFGPTAGEPETARRVAELTLQFAGISTDKVQELQTISYEELAAASQKALLAVSEEKNGGRNSLGFPTVNWQPIVDGDFLPASPFAEAAPEYSKGVPLMVGSTLSEFANLNPRIAGHQAWGPDEVRNYLKETNGDNADAIYAAYGKAYPELEPRNWLTVDSGLRPAVLRTATLKAQQGDPAYVYLFAWRSPVLAYGWAAGHSSALAFVFDNGQLGEQSNGGGPVVDRLAGIMSQAWINFARNGNPNHDAMAEWPAFTADHPSTMVFDEDPDARIGYDDELMRWLNPGR